tara:strand:- start:45 stop:491 length:447 start_codon:yes stop_codon:yes gene_type:complete
MKKFLYFRTVTDEDDDWGDISSPSDGISTANSCMVPVERITGMWPSNDSVYNSGSPTNCSADKITIFWKSNKDELLNDNVVLNIKQGSSRRVMAAIVSAMTAKVNGDGITIVADDVTTDYDGTTRSAVYLTPDITSCGDITQSSATSV